MSDGSGKEPRRVRSAGAHPTWMDMDDMDDMDGMDDMDEMDDMDDDMDGLLGIRTPCSISYGLLQHAGSCRGSIRHRGP